MKTDTPPNFVSVSAMEKTIRQSQYTVEKETFSGNASNVVVKKVVLYNLFFIWYIHSTIQYFNAVNSLTAWTPNSHTIFWPSDHYVLPTAKMSANHAQGVNPERKTSCLSYLYNAW